VIGQRTDQGCSPEFGTPIDGAMSFRERNSSDYLGKFWISAGAEEGTGPYSARLCTASLFGHS